MVVKSAKRDMYDDYLLVFSTWQQANAFKSWLQCSVDPSKFNSKILVVQSPDCKLNSALDVHFYTDKLIRNSLTSVL